MAFNIYSSRLHTNHIIYIGIEGLNKENSLNNVFSINSFSNMYHSTFLFSLYIILIILVVTNLLKLIYEINLKPRILTHLLIAFHEALMVLLIIGLSFLFGSDESLTISEQIKSPSFLNNYWLVYLRKHLITIISILFICYPFRLIALISWFDYTDNFIDYVNTLFRMIPGISIVFLLILSFSLSFSAVLY